MPITFELQPGKQLAIFRHVGDVSDDELLDFYKDFFSGPEAGECTNLLIHLEQTKSSGRSGQALRSLAKLLEERFRDGSAGRRVVVVAPADHSFGLARMYEAFSGRIPWEFHVFRDDAAAMEWLGID